MPLRSSNPSEQIGKVESVSESFGALGNASVTEIGSEASFPFAHEAGVWLPDSREVLFTSNQYYPDGRSGPRAITIWIVNVDTDEIRQLTPDPPVPGSNGATNYKGKVLVCAQGDWTTKGSLTLVDPKGSDKTEIIVDSFYGIPFNSPNDVVINGLDGSIWFTDPDYAWLQGLTHTKQLPNQVYCYHPDTKVIRVVADDTPKPNGIAFSKDFKQAYITDTSSLSFDKSQPGNPRLIVDPTKKATIYVYDVVSLPSGPKAGYTLANKRVFAFATSPAPDGIKVDSAGNVWSGCGDGIHVWNSDGIFLGKIAIDGGIANFCFTDPGTIIAFNENRLVKVTGISVGGTTVSGALDVSL